MNNKVGLVSIRDFDLGLVSTLGAVTDLTDKTAPSYVLDMSGADATQRVKIFFAQPEQIFRMKIYPFITINRDEISPALNRYMGVEQKDYRIGVSNAQITAHGKSGYAQFENKLSAQPFDITYTLSCFDRYEGSAQAILNRLLRIFPPIGKLNVIDSLQVARTYDCYFEGGVVNLQEAVDPVTRVRGYAISLRVEAELDLADPFVTNAVTDFGIGFRLK